MPTAVTFDFHNTLIRCDDWFDLEVRELPARVGMQLGLEPEATVENIYRSIRSDVIKTGNEIDAASGVIETWRRIGVTLELADVSPIVDDLMRELVDRSTLIDGVSEALAAVSSADVAVGVISSAVHHDFLEWALAFHGIRNTFDDVVTSASVGFYKSRPEIYSLALDRLGATPEESVHVGDSFRFDHLTSSTIGVRTIWLNPELAPVPDGARPPTAEIRSMRDLPDVLESVLSETGTADAD